MCMVGLLLGLFCNQKTAYEMRISDWSSDVCSSDLIREVMSDEVKYCFDDQYVDDVLENMGDIQVRRLPVVDRDKRLVGIVSITDLAGNGDAREAGEALGDIARPSAQHSQTIDRKSTRLNSSH